MLQEVFIILGSPNTPTGELSVISKSRLNYCVHHYKLGNKVLCTGGWGPHFNTSEHPHAFYAKKYLIHAGGLIVPTIQLSFATLLCSVFALFIEQPWTLTAPSNQSICSLLALICVC